METKKVILGSILGSLLACMGIHTADAQEVVGAAEDGRVDATQVRETDHEGGFDWGLLGLLGLLGLIPRKRSDVVVHRDDANRHNSSGPTRT